jgi:hypothetical protein
MTIFYCLRFETPPTEMARSPYLHSPGRGWPGYTPRHWVPFSSPCTIRRATVEVFDPDSTWDDDSISKAQHGQHRKRLFHHGVFSRWRGKNGSTELFPRNGCCTVACLHGCYFAIGLHVTLYIYIYMYIYIYICIYIYI